MVGRAEAVAHVRRGNLSRRLTIGQQALMGMGGEERILRQILDEVSLVEAGCCGMAGAFGFEAEHYDVSIACGERALLPVVRSAAPETLIIADGFSCREQIAQTTDRQALAFAEVLALALRQEPRGAAGAQTVGAYPERALAALGPAGAHGATTATVLVALGIGAIGLLVAIVGGRRICQKEQAATRSQRSQVQDSPSCSRSSQAQ
jgi:hypothetical protein